MGKIMTILEGRVPQEHWDALRNAQQRLPALPPGLEQSFIAQDSADPAVWRVIGVWVSRAAFDAMQQTMGTPPPLLLFRSLGVEPALNFLDIVSQMPV